MSRLTRLGMIVVAGAVVAACGAGEADYPYRQGGKDVVYAPSLEDAQTKRQTIFGEGGLNLFGNRKAEGEGGGAGLGVNSYLWRASLDTVVYMPVASADPFGGVIITDWHSPSGVADERFKMNVYILGRALRADGVRVALFRQVRDGGGNWRDAAIPEKAAMEVEDAILTRARQLRNETVQR